MSDTDMLDVDAGAESTLPSPARLLHMAFPHGWRTIETSSAGYKCGFFAIINSMRAQHGSLGVPTIDELDGLLQHPDIRDFVVTSQASSLDATQNFRADQLAAVLLHWGRGRPTPLNLCLGLVVENEPPFVVPTSTSDRPDVIMVWIHNNGAGSSDEDDPAIMGHYSGLRPTTEVDDPMARQPSGHAARTSEPDLDMSAEPLDASDMEQESNESGPDEEDWSDNLDCETPILGEFIHVRRLRLWLIRPPGTSNVASEQHEPITQSDLWEAAFATVERLEAIVSQVLSNAGVDGIGNVELDGFLSAEMVLTTVLDSTQWACLMQNLRHAITRTPHIQDYYPVSDNSIRLVIGAFSDRPALPQDLLANALAEPHQIRINKGIIDGRQHPAPQSPEWRERQCLALLLRYHIALNPADLAAVMTWIHKHDLSTLPLPIPQEQALRSLYAVVMDTLEHLSGLGDIEGQIARPPTSRRLNQQAKWAILLTTPSGMRRRMGSGAEPLIRTNSPSFFMDLTTGPAHVFTYQGRSRDLSFFLVTCTSEPNQHQMDATRVALESYIARSEDLVVASFPLTGPLLPSACLRFGVEIMKQAATCCTALQAAQTPRLDLKKVIEAGAPTQAIVACRTSNVSNHFRSPTAQMVQILSALADQVPDDVRFSRIVVILEGISSVRFSLDHRTLLGDMSGQHVFATALDRVVRLPEDVNRLVQETAGRLFVLRGAEDEALWMRVSSQNQERMKDDLRSSKFPCRRHVSRNIPLTRYSSRYLDAWSTCEPIQDPPSYGPRHVRRRPPALGPR